jgi:hypothetical protein
VLRNQGDAPVRILSVKPSCGCTVAEWPRTPVPPGKNAPVSCRLTLKGLRAMQKKLVRVRTNDPVNPHLVLTMQGNVLVEVDLAPHYISFGEIDPEACVTQRVDVVATNRSVTITGVECRHSAFAATIEEVGGRPTRIAVRTCPPLGPGAQGTRITVKTDDRKVPVLGLPVSARVLDEITFLPSQVVLRRSEAPTVDRMILLRPGTTPTFKVLGVVPPLEGVEVEQSSLGRNMVRINLRKLPVKEELAGKHVLIRTDLERMREIRVPIRLID